MIEFEPPLRLQLDSNALASNWQTLARLSGTAATGAAVKADGYGLGAREVVQRLRDTGCRDFFVAHWSEAAAIADLVPAGSISVLNGIIAAEISLIRQLGAIPVLNTPQQIQLWKAAGGGPCHVMLDSGINRLGIGPKQVNAVLFEGLDIDILMSHLASADEDSAQNAAQLATFVDIARNVRAKRRSFANSAGIMLGTNYQFDLTRPGLSIYGGIARAEMQSLIKPVVSIQSRVLQVRHLDKGDTIGYNATYVCSTPIMVATVAVGYADGYLRGFSNKGTVTFDGRDMPVIGRVSMDLITIEVPKAVQLVEGDWVDIAYDLVSASRQSGLSQYELLTLLGDRACRCWR